MTLQLIISANPAARQSSCLQLTSPEITGLSLHTQDLWLIACFVFVFVCMAAVG